MKVKIKMKNSIGLLLVFLLFSCQHALDETVYSSFVPDNFFNSQEDAESLLLAAYAAEQKQGTDGFRNILVMAEVNTDLLIIREGGLRGLAQPLEDFTWNPAHEFFETAWSRYYSAIYKANLVIDHVPNIDFDENRKNEIIAEARFLRASNYMYLYDLFGPVPLIISSEVNADDRPSRAEQEEFVRFVENELLEVSAVLPVEQAEYGRATKGAAWAFLTKFYLNNRKWDKVVERADELIDLGVYGLFDSQKRTDLFLIENEENREFIYVRPHIAQPGLGTNYLPHAAPPNYKYRGAVKTNYATQLKTLSSFLDSFHPADERKEVIITSYEDLNGNIISLGKDDARSFKFQEDLPATGADLGNDFPVVRYADILLSKAEALNELNGPNQESINLINQVREKANVPPLSLSSFGDKTALRDHILKERGWEFFTEELRRQDLIRHGRFIEYAKARGKVAFDYQIRYPIPQSEIDRNPNLIQNDGY